MGILVIALSINPRPLSALELKLSGLIMESRVDTAGDNQNAHVIISKYIGLDKMALSKTALFRSAPYNEFSDHIQIKFAVSSC